MATWPSTPDDNGEVPALASIIYQTPELGRHVVVLMEEVGHLEDVLDELAYQTVVESVLGPVTVPCIARHMDGSLMVFYSHAGRWRDGDIRRFQSWMVAVRSVDVLADAEVYVVHDGDDLPPPVLDLTADARYVKMLLLSMPYIEDDHAANAQLVRQAVNTIWDFDLDRTPASVSDLDDLQIERIGNIDANNYLLSYLVTLFGDYLGELMGEHLGATWVAVEDSEWPQLQVGEQVVDLYGEITAWLVEGAASHSLYDYYTRCQALASD